MNQPAPAVGVAMAEALAKSNIPLRMPKLPERIWLWLRDNPHRTCAEIAAALHEKEAYVASAVHKMFAGTPSMLSRQRGSRQGKGLFEYAALGREYQPSTFKRDDAPKVVAEPGTVMQAVRVEPAPAPTPRVEVAAHGVDLDALTLGQLKALRDDLNNLFRSFR